MISDDLRRKALEVSQRINNILEDEWLKEREAEIKKLDHSFLSPGFWQKPDAKEVARRLSVLKREVEKFKRVQKLNEEIQVMLELYKDVEEEVDLELEKIVEIAEKEAKEFEIERFLSQKYDDLNAFVSFSAGAGGVDAQDWTEILVKMYIRWAENKGFEVKILDETRGEEAGIKSATLYIKGDFAYGLLRGESGVHRLVRISPFDANKRRHTSFALVEVIPEIEEVEEISIDEKDLRIEISRASGHGGQNVQKVETAVRIVHIPTGISAECQDERSQAQNKQMAMKILKSRILMYEKRKRDETIKEIKGEFKSIEWGNEIRSYVFQPYQLVKDHRTGCETGNVSSVLEGDIDEFIWAYLKSQK